MITMQGLRQLAEKSGVTVLASGEAQKNQMRDWLKIRPGTTGTYRIVPGCGTFIVYDDGEPDEIIFKTILREYGRFMLYIGKRKMFGPYVSPDNPRWFGPVFDEMIERQSNYEADLFVYALIAIMDEMSLLDSMETEQINPGVIRIFAGERGANVCCV